MATSASHINEPKKSGGNKAPDHAHPSSKKSQVLGYMFLPGIVPQIKYITRGGFGYLAFLIALVYQAVRILPATHPYTKYENIGSYGLRDVITAAANNVKLDRKNIDQVLIFFAILTAIVIMALQLISFFVLMISGDAWAQGASPSGVSGIFATANPDTDIAFHMLREVFGIPDMFGTLPNGQTNLHIALQGMFQFYNLAILIVAVIVFLYYIIVVVGETAQSGTPFGQRFSHIYAPIRLVVAIGLLVPLNYGFNGAQYLTFFAAKMGSGFATTGWTQFNQSLDGLNPLGADGATLIAKSEVPDVDALVQFMAVAVTCRESYRLNEAPGENLVTGQVKFGLGGIQYLPLTSNTLATLVNYKWDKDIQILFGRPKMEGESRTGDYEATCGQIVIPVNLTLQETNDSFDAGQLQKDYFNVIFSLWGSGDLKEIGEKFAQYYTIDPELRSYGGSEADYTPNSSDKEPILSQTRQTFDTLVTQYHDAARAETDTSIKEETIKRGWGGAGIWYNRIAQINGAYVIATRNIPQPKAHPEIMNFVQDARRAADTNSAGCEMFEPNLGGGQAIEFDRGVRDLLHAKVLNDAYQFWGCDKSKDSHNFILDIASAIYGLNGLLAIRDRHDTGTTNDNGDPIYFEIHPLAKLSALGKGLIESAIRNMAFGIASALGAGLLSGTAFGPALQSFSSMFVSISTVALSIGFITYYILPFLPFMYFFFAVGSWVKSIFEAMVGAPLWALAHLRIDGDGLPGKMALNGYLLIFEIFLRPILTVFGLLGGMAVFTSLAVITNEVFDIVVSVGVGVDLAAESESSISMHTVDVFFFTTTYAVILYMMAVSSFKMINLVPNNITRWLGNAVSSFSDTAADSTEGLTQYAAIGGARIGGQLAGGITQGAQGLGSAVGQPLQQIFKGSGGATTP